jgi:acetyl-CoA C-acetyltransferase
MLILMSGEEAARAGSSPSPNIIAHAQASSHPSGITHPALAARKVLAKGRHDERSMELIEINEAFAAMPLLSTKLLGDGDPQRPRRSAREPT